MKALAEFSKGRLLEPQIKDEKGCHYKLSKEYNDIYGSIDKYFQQIKSLKTILFRCTKDVSDSSRTGIGVWKIERA